jgi:4-hydroxy-3-polyprenylbenzoate decarboxylase
VLVVVPREVPLHQGHLESLARLAALGARIVPPMLTFYHHPESVSDLIDHVVGKVLDQLGLEHGLVDEWDTPGDPGPC